MRQLDPFDNADINRANKPTTSLLKKRTIVGSGLRSRCRRWGTAGGALIHRGVYHQLSSACVVFTSAFVVMGKWLWFELVARPWQSSVEPLSRE